MAQHFFIYNCIFYVFSENTTVEFQLYYYTIENSFFNLKYTLTYTSMKPMEMLRTFVSLVCSRNDNDYSHNVGHLIGRLSCREAAAIFSFYSVATNYFSRLPFHNIIASGWTNTREISKFQMSGRQNADYIIYQKSDYWNVYGGNNVAFKGSATR